MNEQNLPGTLIPKTPDELFASKEESNVYITRKAQGNALKKIVERVEYPEEGGILVYHQSFKYPEKGHRDDFMMTAVQITKRNLIGWIKILADKKLVLSYLGFLILPWKCKIKVLENWMKEFIEYATLIENVGNKFVMEPKYLTPFGRELRRGVFTFFKFIGISEEVANSFSSILTALIDPDLAYRYRIQDIFSETTAEQILKNPRKEMIRLVSLLAQRESREHLVAKFNNVSHLLSYALWLPKIHRAFNEAIKAVDFKGLQFDEGDRYNVKFLDGYNFFGMTQKERIEKWIDEAKEQHTFLEVHYDNKTN